MVALTRRLRHRRLELLGRRVRAMALLGRGDVAGFDAEVDTYGSVASGLRQPLYLWPVPLWRGMRAVMSSSA